MNELNTFLEEDECRILRSLLSNTTINIQFEDCKGSPQGNAISGTLFNLAFKKSTRKNE